MADTKTSPQSQVPSVENQCNKNVSNSCTTNTTTCGDNPINNNNNKKKKRKFENNNGLNLHNSNFFKIRSIFKDLRPCFIEVICTPEFKSCKAGQEIRRQIQTVLELYKQLNDEIISLESSNKQKGQPLVAGTKEVPSERHGEEKTDKPQQEKVANKAAEVKLTGQKAPELNPEVLRGSYVIGGSPVGWNFMMYPGSGSVYYGETKASFLSRQLKS